MVSASSQRKQSIKINQEETEVFREFYPTNEEFVTLEGVWTSDKFVLLKRIHESKTESQDGDLKEDAASTGQKSANFCPQLFLPCLPYLTPGFSEVFRRRFHQEDSMGSEIEALEERLTSMLGQLRTECGILERMVYKNKNQHRRCSYFQYLLKVRRDLRLLLSAKLEELVDSCFLVLTGKRPKQKVHLLESLKRRKCDSGKHNFMERLLGAARLLAQMVEPMLKAATEISTLLARSFFVGFSLTILALLACLRVLIQQILLDVVSVYNMVSASSQRKQSIKINQEETEVFREFYPTNEEFVTLEGVWTSDKFVLLERIHESKTESQDGDLKEDAASAVKYQSIECFLTDDEPVPEQRNEDQMAEIGPSHIKDDKIDLCTGPSMDSNNGKAVESCGEVGDGSGIASTSSKKLPLEAGFLPASESSPSSNTSKLKSGSRKVAFISVNNRPGLTANVKNPPLSATTDVAPGLVENETKGDDDKDPFCSLLTGGNKKGKSLLEF